jgi:hypothetical protein
VRHVNQLIAVISCLVGLGSFAAGGPRSPAPIFIQYCSGCHGLNGDGGGATSGIPKFRDFVGAFAGDELGRTYVLHVPGIANTGLDADTIAAVVNYVMTTWGGASLPQQFRAFTKMEVETRRRYPVSDIVALRREVVVRLRAKGIATATYPWP